MLIGGVSTLFFNGNPLLRFDGYYVMSDVLEIPNLGSRANRYIGYLIQRYLFGLENIQSPVSARGEPFWLFVYAVASFCYRIFIVAAIALFVATRFFVVGVILAIWAGVLMLVVPLVKQIWFLLTSAVLRRHRGRAFAACASVIAAVTALLSLMPVPYRTVTEGVVWMPTESAVRAGAQGMVSEVLATPNSLVQPGESLIQMRDPLLAARVRVLEARATEFRRRHASKDLTDPAEANIIREQLRHTEADLNLARKRQRDLLVRSPAEGRFILPRAADLAGSYVPKGKTLGYVARLEDPVVRVIVPEDAADLVRQRTEAVELRFADRMAAVVPAIIERELPTISDTLPENLKALAKLLHLELRPTTPTPVSTMGGRVYVRFDHGKEPLARRIYRSIRQLFLEHFNV
jgi:putative peptide zinc metalloprotease protein